MTLLAEFRELLMARADSSRAWEFLRDNADEIERALWEADASDPSAFHRAERQRFNYRIGEQAKRIAALEAENQKLRIQAFDAGPGKDELIEDLERRIASLETVVGRYRDRITALESTLAASAELAGELETRLENPFYDSFPREIIRRVVAALKGEVNP